MFRLSVVQFECWAIEAPLAIVKRDTMSTPISVSLTAAEAADTAVTDAVPDGTAVSNAAVSDAIVDIYNATAVSFAVSDATGE